MLEQASLEETKNLVVLMHGVGSNGDDLFGLVPYLQDGMPNSHFISPNAPFNYDMAPFGYQWFSLQDRSYEPMINGVYKAISELDEIIKNKLRELNLTMKDVILIGFSQGAMVACHYALHSEEKISAVLAYSGSLISEKFDDIEVNSVPNFCLIHGVNDDVVPFVKFEYSLKFFKQRNISIQSLADEVDHSISMEGLKFGINFLKSI